MQSQAHHGRGVQEVLSQEKSMKKLIAAFVVAFALAGCGVQFVGSDETVVKKAEYNNMVNDYGRLKSAPQGLTEAQCKAVAEISAKSIAGSVTETVKDQCKGKTETVTKIKWRDRQAGANSPPAAQQQSAQLPPPPVGGKFWGWVHPEATAVNKKPCFADRQIRGMPVECSSVEVFARAGSETEVEWNARVAAKNGIAVGVVTDKGTISATQFGRVEVKKP